MFLTTVLGGDEFLLTQRGLSRMIREGGSPNNAREHRSQANEAS